jgi:hypothetical protein
MTVLIKDAASSYMYRLWRIDLFHAFKVQGRSHESLDIYRTASIGICKLSKRV